MIGDPPIEHLDAMKAHALHSVSSGSSPQLDELLSKVRKCCNAPTIASDTHKARVRPGFSRDQLDSVTSSVAPHRL